MVDDRLIVALDVPTLEDMKSLVMTLGDTVNHYKVGMELFYREGPATVQYLKKTGKKVFLDLKLHDIPNTVAEGLCSLLHLGVDMFNVHASGGYTMMKTAADRLHAAAESLGVKPPKLLAVTILTSISDEEWHTLGMSGSVAEQVLHLAKLSREAGLDGVVASPQEAGAIRKACGHDFLIVTPGIRPTNSAVDDQSRIAAPAMALRAGASHLVVGRPIRAAAEPKAAAQAILAEMKGV